MTGSKRVVHWTCETWCEFSEIAGVNAVRLQALLKVLFQATKSYNSQQTTPSTSHFFATTKTVTRAKYFKVILLQGSKYYSFTWFQVNL